MLVQAWIYRRGGNGGGDIVRGNPSVRLIHGSKTNSEIRRVSVNSSARARLLVHVQFRLSLCAAALCSEDFFLEALAGQNKAARSSTSGWTVTH